MKIILDDEQKIILDDGQEVIISEELKANIMKEIKQATKQKNFIIEPDARENFYIAYNSNIFWSSVAGSTEISAYNCFTNREYAEKVAFKQLMERKILAFKDKYDNDELDWNDNKIDKYYIEYDLMRDCLRVRSTAIYKKQGVICFSTKEVVEKCIDVYKEELIKYFNLDI